MRQLLETALEPVVQERLQDKELDEQEQAILGMAVCDPAAGSGHFLVGAAHYLAERLGGIRARLAGEDDPTPELYQQALRDVIANCIYGVDMNPMAVELCKVTLWMESMEPGRPSALSTTSDSATVWSVPPRMPMPSAFLTARSKDSKGTTRRR